MRRESIFAQETAVGAGVEMAWQSLSGMGGGNNNGNGAGAEGSHQGNQPQGTEYTLQGALLASACYLAR